MMPREYGRGVVGISAQNFMDAPSHGQLMDQNHQSVRFTPAAGIANQNMGAKLGDDEIEPLGSDEGDN